MFKTLLNSTGTEMICPDHVKSFDKKIIDFCHKSYATVASQESLESRYQWTIFEVKFGGPLVPWPETLHLPQEQTHQEKRRPQPDML